MVADTFEMSTGMTASGAPVVVFQWGSMTGVFTPAQARQHAAVVLETAERSVVEASVAVFAQQILGVSLSEAAELTLQALPEFRVEDQE